MTDGINDEQTVTIINGVATDLTLEKREKANVTYRNINAGDVIVFTKDANDIADMFAVVADINYPADDAEIKSVTYTMTPFSNAVSDTNSDVEYMYRYIKDIYGSGNILSLSNGESIYVDDLSTNQYYYKYVNSTKYQLNAGMYWMGRVDSEDTLANPPLRTYVLAKVKDDELTDIIALDSETRSN